MPSPVTLIAAAIALGQRLQVDFDKVMLGIFICWTPQTVVAAVSLTSWLLYRELRACRPTPWRPWIHETGSQSSARILAEPARSATHFVVRRHEKRYDRPGWNSPGRR